MPLLATYFCTALHVLSVEKSKRGHLGWSCGWSLLYNLPKFHLFNALVICTVIACWLLTQEKERCREHTFRKVPKHNITSIYASHGLFGLSIRGRGVTIIYLLPLYFLQIGASQDEIPSCYEQFHIFNGS